MLLKRLGAFTATALISFSSANNRRRPEPLAQVNDESDAPKIEPTPSKDLSPCPIRLTLLSLYTSHTGSRSSATVRRIVMQGRRTPGKDTSLVSPNTLERPAPRSYESSIKKPARYVLIILDELGGPSKRMNEALTCIRQPRNRLGDADKH